MAPLSASFSLKETLPPSFTETHPQERPAGLPTTPEAWTHWAGGLPVQRGRTAQGLEPSGVTTRSKQLKRAKEAWAPPLSCRSAGAAKKDVSKHPAAVFPKLCSKVQFSQRSCRIPFICKLVMYIKGWLMSSETRPSSMGSYASSTRYFCCCCYFQASLPCQKKKKKKDVCFKKTTKLRTGQCKWL